jgi:hypothetical protein
MAESSSPALPGGVEWLPGSGGSRVLRIHPSVAEPPALILRVAAGGEERIEAGSGPATEYAIRGGLSWSAAWLQWPDGTRAAIPLPHGPDAEVIEFRPRRNRDDREPTVPPEPSTFRGFAGAPREPVSPPDAGVCSAAAAPREPAAAPDAGSARGFPGAPTAPREPDAGSGAPTASREPAAPPDADSTRGLPGAPPEADAGSRAWTTPPQVGASMAEAQAEWRSRRAELAHGLAEAAAALARARDGERTARDSVLAALAAARADLRASRAAREADASAIAALTGELGAERAAHAVTRGSMGTLADALSTARTELAAAKTRGEAAHAGLTAAKTRAEAELAGVRRELTRARAEVASLRDALESERAARAAAEAALRERDLLQRVAELAAPRDQADLERRAREQAEAAAAADRRPADEAATLLANLDAAAAALRATVKPPAAPTVEAGAEPSRAASPAAAAAPASTESPAATSAPAVRAGSPAAAGAVPTAEAASPAAASPAADVSSGAAEAPAATTALVPAGSDGRLRRALVALAREDAVAAGALLVGLLPAQGAVLHDALTYDLTVRGVGTFAVFVEDGSARVVRLSRRRPRGQALFHLNAEPAALAELLAGERRKVGRFRRTAKLSGRRRHVQVLAPLRDARLSLAEAVAAGARLEPGLVYQALPFAVEPAWTRGHRFTVAQQIIELAPRAWHITARDGLPLLVAERSADAPADATVTMTRAAFERLLRDERPALGDRPIVRGDRDAVAALKRWTDLARGV